MKIYNAAKGSKTRHKQMMEIMYHDLNHAYKPDSFCVRLWEYSIPEWMPNNLRVDMVNALRVFDRDMALEIADNLIDCWTGLGLRLTGIDHVDELLGKLYMRILSYAHRNDIKLLYDDTE